MNNLRIEGFFSPDRGENGSGIPDDEIVAFRSFRLVKKVDEHSFLDFIAIIKPEGASNIRSRAGQEIVVSCSGECIFRGVVRSIESEYRKSGGQVSVSAVSWSAASDDERHTRIFRNEEKTFNDILSAFEFAPSKAFLGCGADTIRIECKDGAASDNIEFPVMQNHVTDMEFARQAARFCGCHVWVNDTDETPSLLISEMNGSLQLSEEDVLGYTDERTMRNSRWWVQTDRVIRLGTELHFSVHWPQSASYSGIVTGMEIAYDSGRFIFSYLVEEKEHSENQSFFSSCSAVTLCGEVTDNEDPEKNGRVKVSFADSIAEELLSDNAPMITTAQLNGSESGGLIYIPAKGDKVLVRYEHDSLTIFGTVRTESYPDEFSNPNERYLINIFGRSILLTEKTLELRSGDNSFEMTDDRITVTVGKTKLEIVDGEIKVSTQKLGVKCSESATISSAGEVNIKAQNITVKADQRFGVKGMDIRLN